MSVLRPEFQELLIRQAAEEAARAASRRPRRRGRLAAWFASHSILGLFVGALVVGGAGATTAAVVSSIHGTPSAPTHGSIPASSTGQANRRTGSGARESYRLATIPSLQVGQPGWCDAFGMGAPRRTFGSVGSYGSFGCGSAPTAQSHVFGGSAGGGRHAFQWHLVDRTVAYLQTPDGRRFLPRADPGLPNDWRVIVLLPGQTRNDHVRFRDAAGRPVSPRMKTAGSNPIATSTKSVPATSACGISAPRGAGFDARGSHWVTQLHPVPNLNGSAFMACAQTAYRVDDHWAEVTVLVDAASAGAAEPVALPGTHRTATGALELPAIATFYFPKGPITDHNSQHGPVDAGFTGTARRIGRAWVIARAPSAALRTRTLDEITIRAPGA